MREIACAQCGARKLRNTGEVNRALRTGAPLYCSRDCTFAAKRVGRKAPGWHEQRFTPRPTAVATACAECGRAMWLPATKVAEYRRCGQACLDAHRERERENLARHCETCGDKFYPRPRQLQSGGGRYCSQRCNAAGVAVITSPEVLKLAQQRRREKHAAGLIPWKTGEDHHAWKGGKEAALARRRNSGKMAAGLRAYRKKNPHKAREFSQRRKNAKLERLPYGTIPRIGNMQRWKCAVCAVGIKDNYHLDHITPLARGGKHEPRNLQLLCPTCNVRKSAKDPIAYMRELGRLL